METRVQERTEELTLANQSFQFEIAERKLAEEALRESQERLEELFEEAPIGYHEFDIGGRITRVNHTELEMLGHTAEEMLGQPVWKFVVEGETSRQAVLAKLAGSLPPGKGFERIYRRKDGTPLPVLIEDRLLRDAENRITGIRSILQDITERKRAEESLRLTQFSLDSAADAVFWLGPDAAFTYVNDAACRLLGYSREELLRMTAHDVNPAHSKAVWPTQWAELKQQKPLTFEASLRTKDARSVAVELTPNHFEFESKEYDCVFARDITERKHIEAHFRQTQKMEAIGTLAGGMAHDFSNLLTVINGYSSSLLRDLARDDPRRSDLEEINRAGQRASSLTSQLLAFSCKQVLQPRILDLNDVVTDMGRMLRRLLSEEIQLVVLTQPGLGRVKADLGQIQQIIMNLAINARDAMPQGGKLTIATANVDLDEDCIRGHAGMPAGPYVMLAVSDNGTGMDAETRARIFEPFFTTKEPGKGTGLGLSTVHGVVKQSGGFIVVDSELGKGATFKIYLPREGKKASKLMGLAEEKLSLKGTETVLVVEDEPSIRTLAARILREQGYTVLEASNGAEALRMDQEFAGEIHLVLTDVVMPEMSGKALSSQIEAARPGIKVLYVSGYTSDVIVHHGVLGSDVSFLQKPFTEDALARKVREVLDSPAYVPFE